VRGVLRDTVCAPMDRRWSIPALSSGAADGQCHPALGPLGLYDICMGAQQLDRQSSDSLGEAQEDVQRSWWRRVFGR